jgi:hypothetical protein
MTNPDESSNRQQPLQFGLRSLLTASVVVAMVFGTLRWLGVSATASALVLVILVVAVAAAVALFAAIARADNG